MAAIFQTTFWNWFSWMKMYKFRLSFHWSLFPRVQLTIFKHWFSQWLGAGQATSHNLNQLGLVYWRIYASLGLSELTIAINVKLLSTFSRTPYKNPCPNGIGDLANTSPVKDRRVSSIRNTHWLRGISSSSFGLIDGCRIRHYKWLEFFLLTNISSNL